MGIGEEMNENFSINITFSESDRPSVLRDGYCPRGIYYVTTTAVGEDLSRQAQKPMLRFEHKITRAFVSDDNGGFRPEPGLAGRVIRNTIMLPDGGTYDNLRRQDILGAMVGHNQMSATDTVSGSRTLTPAAFLNREAQLMYDPPAPGTDGYPDVKYLSADKASSSISGSFTAISWPQDRKAHKAKAKAATGNTSASFGNSFSGVESKKAAPTPADAVSAFGGNNASTGGGWS
jgi:hypothetical protein